MTIVKESNGTYSIYENELFIHGGFPSYADAWLHMNDLITEIYDDR